MLRRTDKLVFYAGNSMWPALRTGDRLVLETCNARQLRPGEVVVFTLQPQRYVCHRVLSVREEAGCIFVKTQGDSSSEPDEEWPSERLIGRVIEVLPVNGRPRKLRAQPVIGWMRRHRLSFSRLARGFIRRISKALKLCASVGRCPPAGAFDVRHGAR